MKRQLSPVNDRLFVAFLTLLIWVPLPWASNRVFAWSLMEMAVFVIAMIWLWQYHQGKRVLTPAFRRARPVLIILAVWLVYTGFQVLPMPPQWVLFISPESNAIHALVAEANAEPLTRWITISVAPDVTSQAFVKSVAYALFFALTLLLVSSRTKLKWLAYSVVAAGTFQALYGIFMVLSGLEYGFFLEKYGFKGVVTGTFVNRNNQANFLALCMSVGIGLLLAQLNERSGRSWRAILRSLFDWALSSKMRVRFMLMVMAVALVMTHSRMGNTAFFLSLLIAGVISIILSKRSSRSAVMLLTSLVIIDLMIIGSMVGMDTVVDRIEHTSVETEHRDEVAADTLSYWSDYRWFGSGLGTYYTTYPRYRSEAVNGFYNHAHNDYLEMLAEVGLVGVALLGLLIIATIWIVFSVLLKRRDPWCRAFAFSALMSICAISLHATVDYNLQIPANSIYFMVVLALAWVAFGLPSLQRQFVPVASTRNADSRGGTKWPAAFGVVLLSVFFLKVLAWCSAELISSGSNFQMIQWNQNQIIATATWQQQMDQQSTAITLVPANFYSHYTMGRLAFWGATIESADPAEQEQEGGPRSFEQMGNQFKKATENIPVNPMGWLMRAASLYYLQDFGDEFEQSMSNAVKMGPMELAVQSGIITIGANSWVSLSPISQALVLGVVGDNLKKHPKQAAEMLKNTPLVRPFCKQATGPERTLICHQLE